jgi:hypothetical protein
VERSGTESRAALDRMSRRRQMRMKTEAPGEFPLESRSFFALLSLGEYKSAERPKDFVQTHSALMEGL